MCLKLLVLIVTKWHNILWFPYWFAQVVQHLLMGACYWYVLIRFVTGLQPEGKRQSWVSITSNRCCSDTLFIRADTICCPLYRNTKPYRTGINTYQKHIDAYSEVGTGSNTVIATAKKVCQPYAHRRIPHLLVRTAAAATFFVCKCAFW